MKIVFFGTSANHFEPKRIGTFSIPSRAEMLSELAAKYSEHTFAIAAEKPSVFLLDLEKDGSLKEKAENVEYRIVSESESNPFAFAKIIEEMNADIAISASGWEDPFDWLSVKDAMIAKILESKGIKTIANSQKNAMDFFDKARTKFLLENLQIKTPKSVFVDHWLFWCAHTKAGVRENICKENALFEIENLRYPVVIKDTLGLSSYGTVVANNFAEAKDYLLSRRNSSDRLVEEYESGRQFGLEIHGIPGNYRILPPAEFSLTKHGITSPKQSVKISGANAPQIDSLEKMMIRLAESVSLKGIAQVDLVLAKDGWTIIEINPRLSGMTNLYAASFGKSAVEMLFCAAIGKTPQKSEKQILNFKIPPVSDSVLKKIFEKDGVESIFRIENYAPSQKREIGYAELFLNAKNALEILESLKNEDSSLIEDSFFEKAVSLIEQNRKSN